MRLRFGSLLESGHALRQREKLGADERSLAQTTGTAIADIPQLTAKTGIANRALRPLLGIVDPLNTDSCPREVHISSGLDVLFHSLESWTAIPYYERVPRPMNPINRPAYQGSSELGLFALLDVETGAGR